MTFRGQTSCTRPALSQSKGYTLVELLVGATLSAAVMAAVLSSYIFLGRGLGRLANQQILETEGRRTLAYFTQDAQKATGISGTPTAGSVTFVIASSSGTTTVAYAYNRAAGTLTRTPSSGNAQIILRNIVIDTDATHAPNYINYLQFRYYDSGGRAYDDGTFPYTTDGTTSSYLTGIKQVSLQFNTQLGVAQSGTQTIVNQVASNRVILRNRGFLQ